MNDVIVIIANTEKAQDRYGHCYGSSHYLITREHINALLNGKQLAFDDGEYSTFLSMTEPIKSKKKETVTTKIFADGKVIHEKTEVLE